MVIYTIVSALLSTSENDSETTYPTSGPIGKFGQKGLIFTFGLTGLLSFLNPFQLVQIFKQAIGNFKLKTERLDIDKNYQNKVQYSLPFDGCWFVYNGGVEESNSHSWNVLTQRYAYDFVVVNEKFERHDEKGTKLKDYYCYNKDIKSCASGIVVKVVDGIRDAPLVGYGIVDFLSRNFIGNHVIIKHADAEYGLYAHLVKKSITVRVGDQVQTGQFIGKCGHSGHSSEPHLHFHLQDRENFFFAMGLPVRFSKVKVNRIIEESHHISCGDFVENSKNEILE